MAQRTFLGHSLFFFIGNLLPQVSSFLLLPLFTHYLTPAEFGIWELLNRVSELFVICLLFNGLRQSVIVFSGRRQDLGGCPALGSSVIIITGVILPLGMAAGFLLQLVSPSPWQGVSSQLFLLTLASVLADASFLSLLSLVQSRLESGLFLLYMSSQVLLRFFLCLFFVCHAGLGMWGAVLSSLISSGAMLMILGCRELTIGPLVVRPAAVLRILFFSLPFIPAGICFFILNHGDRFLLLEYWGPVSVGCYSFGYKIALAVNMMSRAPLMMTWGPKAYRLADQPGGPLLFAQMFDRILGAYLFLGLWFCVFQNEIVAALGPPEYSQAGLVIAPVVLAYFFLSAADFMDCSFYIRGRTGAKSVVAFVTALLMILLYFLFIPRWSVLGAAIATLVGFMAHAGITFVVSRRYSFIPYNFSRVSLGLALAVFTWFVSGMIPAGLPGVLLKCCLFVCLIGVTWAVGLISPSEKQWVREAFSRAGSVFSTSVRRLFSFSFRN